MAYSGAEALILAETFEPRMVLLDLGMPGMSGFETARAFRRDPRFTDTYLCALTGFGEDEHREQSLAAGFNQHLVKPVRMEILKATLAALPAL